MAFTSGRGTTKHCCWGLCKSDSRYIEKTPVTVFINFPKLGKIKDSMTEWEKGQAMLKTEKAKRWVHACGRTKFTLNNITKDTFICSLHFVGGKGPTDDNPHPINATLTDIEARKVETRKRKKPTERTQHIIPKKMKCDNVLNSTFLDSVNDSSNILNSTFLNSLNDTSNHTGDDLIDTNNIEDRVIESRLEKSTQTKDKYLLASKIETMILRNNSIVQIDSPSIVNLNPMSPDLILESEKKCKYFTGLFPNEFKALYEFLGEAKFSLTYWNKTNIKSTKLSIHEQLFVTLLRLRRGFNILTIAHLYSVSESYIRSIFTTWIMFIFHHFKDHSSLMFPDRQSFKHFMPKIFKRFKNIRASIDCTEFKCEMPRNYAQQGNTYSSYKHHCTMKCLIAVNPNGAASFVSDLYEGSIGDVAIFEQCGIMKHINPQDAFLVDKGFTIQHLLLSKQSTIFIPPFLGKREKFTKEEVLLTKRIAKARIHVERYNERLKKFRLIDRVIPLNLKPIASQLVFVAACLVNFQECLCT